MDNGNMGGKVAEQTCGITLNKLPARLAHGELKTRHLEWY